MYSYEERIRTSILTLKCCKIAKVQKYVNPSLKVDVVISAIGLILLGFGIVWVG